MRNKYTIIQSYLHCQTENVPNTVEIAIACFAMSNTKTGDHWHEMVSRERLIKGRQSLQVNGTLEGAPAVLGKEGYF